MQFPIHYRDFILRPEILDDVDELKRFSDQLVDERAMIGRRDKRSKAEWEASVGMAVKAMKTRQAVVIVAEKEKKIVGLSAIFLQAQKMDPIGVLGIMVDRDVRCQGLGRKLMEVIIAWAQDMLLGLECIELGAIADNPPAVALYKQMGFVSVARIPSRLNHFGVYYDEEIMQLWVRPPKSISS
ncbi:MAG: GNAT family N-acetyltransferase [Promethearchaeota archaeon]|nr:MAG: GNAT family N-acetyltransferase [Candidatus Lokiarchaeota archaeon]